MWDIGEVEIVERDTLQSLREEILSVTLEIFQQIARRQHLAQQIAKRKAQSGAPFFDRAAEKRIVQAVYEQSRDNGLDLDFTSRLLSLLFSESIRVQRSTCGDPVSSSAGDMYQAALALEKQGEKIIHLEIGEPDFGPPKEVLSALCTAARERMTQYTPPAGVYTLRQKIAMHLHHKYDVDVQPEQVLVTPGARFAIYLAIRSLLRSGDEVIIVRPAYPEYAKIAMDCGARPIFIDASQEEGWRPPISELDDLMTDATKMLILNNPNNPTGAVISRAELEQIVELARGHDLLILSDEVYADFSDVPFTSLVEFDYEQRIMITSFSKSHGMTGLRIGYTIAPSDIIKRMTKSQQLYLTCVPEPIQVAAMAALDCKDEVATFAQEISKRRSIVSDQLHSLPLVFQRPQAGLYLFPKITRPDLNGDTLSKELLNHYGVCITPGSAFGEHFQQFFRISLCRPLSEVLRAVDCIRRVLS